MSDHDQANLETPITGEIPDESLNGVQHPDQTSDEKQILDDADLTDIPEPSATLGESDETKPV